MALRDEVGGEVIALTMGPPQAESALRACLALGADRRDIVGLIVGNGVRLTVIGLAHSLREAQSA